MRLFSTIGKPSPSRFRKEIQSLEEDAPLLRMHCIGQGMRARLCVMAMMGLTSDQEFRTLDPVPSPTIRSVTMSL